MKTLSLCLAMALLGTGAAFSQGGALESSPEDIRPLRGPVEIPVEPHSMGWLPILVGLVMTALVAWGLSHWFRQRRRLRILTAREKALRALEQARPLMQPESSRAFAYGLSDAVRAFVEARFRCPSTRLTTEEFLHAIARERSDLGLYRPTLVDFLTLCDRGKYARWEMDRRAMDALWASAVAVVECELGGPGERAGEDQAAVPEGLAQPA